MACGRISSSPTSRRCGGRAGELLASALRTALGKRRGAKALFFGTRPNDSEHFFARLLTESDPSVFSQVHAADPSDPPFQKTNLAQGQPRARFWLAECRCDSGRSAASKARPCRTRNLPGVEIESRHTSEVETSHLISAEAWAEVETAHLPPS